MKRYRLLAAVCAVVIMVMGAVIANRVRQDSGRGDAITPSTAGLHPADELRLLGDEPRTLDPAAAEIRYPLPSPFGPAGVSSYLVEIFAGLVTLTPDLQVIPDIARSWTISPDGTDYTFTLRDDVVFSGSGRRVTASDVKHSLDRAANPNTKAPRAALFLGDIAGVREVLDGKAEAISGVIVVDATTLKITLLAPGRYFPAKLAAPVAFVVDKEQIAAEPDTWWKHPNGSGPYRVAEWVRGQRLVFTANESYHGEPKPRIRTVSYITTPRLAGLAAYQNEDVDIAPIYDRLERSTREREHIELPTYWRWNLMLNTRRPPFDDPKVRLAFALAIDRRQIDEGLARSYGSPAVTLLPPWVPGYTPPQSRLDFDPERARRLLAESRYAGKMPPVALLALIVPGSTYNDPHLGTIRDMWATHLGITVEVDLVESTVIDRMIGEGEYQIVNGGMTGTWADPHAFLDEWFFSTQPRNVSRYRNAEVDRLLLRARAEPDQTERMKLYREVEDIILQDVPVIPLVFMNYNYLVKPWVKGWRPTGLPAPILKYVTIED